MRHAGHRATKLEARRTGTLLKMAVEPDLITCATPELLTAIGELRIAAWEASGERPSIAPAHGRMWTDDHDGHAAHWVLREGESIVAAARLCIHAAQGELPDQVSLEGIKLGIAPPVASLNRLVVSPGYRGVHLSLVFDRARLQYAREQGAKSAVALTHLPGRLRDLKSAGFEVVCESRHRTASYAPSFVLVRSSS